MRQVFYLKDEIQFIESFDSVDDLITWVFRWNGQTAYSKALEELIEKNYNRN